MQQEEEVKKDEQQSDQQSEEQEAEQEEGKSSEINEKMSGSPHFEKQEDFLLC